MASPKTTLIIPVESQVRELDAKLLLACAGAEAGFRVVIGSRAFVHYKVASMPRGVYLAKSMRSLSNKMFRVLRRLGHEIVAWDEEALVRLGPEDYYRRRLSPEAVSLVSHLLAWGEDDAEVFRRYPGYPGTPIHVTGNPRVDLLRPELRSYFDPEVADIRRRFGDFILLNTNFGYVNAFVSTMNLMQQSDKPGGELVPGENTVGMTPEVARGLATHKAALCKSFCELIPRLARAFPERTIVVRPHPSESHETWRNAASGLHNVVVINEMSVVPWLMTASVLVHNGCTTAVEAAVLGTPAVAYRPVTSKAFDLELPNELSEEAFDVGELLTAIERTEASGRGWTPDQRAILERHVAALDGPLATDRVIRVLREAGYGEAPPPRSPAHLYLAGWLITHVRARFKRRLSRRSQHRNSMEFHRHRFPGTSAEDLRKRIGRLADLVHRFAGLRVSPLWDHIFLIEN